MLRWIEGRSQFTFCYMQCVVVLYNIRVFSPLVSMCLLALSHFGIEASKPHIDVDNPDLRASAN